jgi:predicted HTH domain antitoxin
LATCRAASARKSVQDPIANAIVKIAAGRRNSWHAARLVVPVVAEYNEVPQSAYGICTMPVLITDDMLAQAGLSEGEATVEIACRLYAANRLTLPAAARWAGLSRVEFEQELIVRNLPLVRIDESYWRQELDSLR